MRVLMQRVLQKYGTQAQLIHEGVCASVWVVFHSSNSKNWQNMDKLYCPLGQIPRGQYLCFLPAGTAVVGDFLQIQGEEYRFCAVEEMRMGQQSIYQWCLLTRKGGEDTWEWTE